MPDPFPPGTTLDADPSLRLRERGRLVIGGSPLRFIRLTEAGAALVRRWLGGEPTGARAGATALARRLVSAGMVHPRPPADAPMLPVTVVVPVKDDQPGLETTLAGLSTMPVVVVDDGSQQPVEVRSEPNQPPATLIRRARSGGPGVARQEGLEQADSPLVAFIDAGVEVTSADVHALCRWFSDPNVVAVGPRVRSVPGPSAIDRYEVDHSPLDLGPTPAPVGHGRTVSYLPTACLVARREVVDEVGGFDPALRFGEDVDLVWRLLAIGDVRYDPTVTVAHPARSTMGALVRQRYGYGLAAAPLARRHGSELAPVRVSGWSLGCWGLAAAGHPVLGSVLAAYTAVALSRKLSTTLPDNNVEAVMLTARGHWHAGRSMVEAGTRVWWPIVAIGLFSPLRNACRVVVGFNVVRRLVATTGALDERLRQLELALADDLAYGTGVWVGAWRARSAQCLLPRVVNWPPTDDGAATGR